MRNNYNGKNGNGYQPRPSFKRDQIPAPPAPPAPRTGKECYRPSGSPNTRFKGNEPNWYIVGLFWCFLMLGIGIGASIA